MTEESKTNPNQKTAMHDFVKHLLPADADTFTKEEFEFVDFINQQKDAGAHYRYSYQGINLDPFRIAAIYNMTDFCMMTILKKTLCAGNRGHKDFKQDLKDIICAAQRKLEMIEEDENNSH